MLVSFDPSARRAPAQRRRAAAARASAEHIARALRDLAEAGAHEAILVLDPITEASVRQCGEVLAALDA